ncbi:MAG: uracil-DNA glycosylase [Xanthobacteraceae bacterium]|jgi:DNA polymerase
MSSAAKHARELISFYLDAGVDALVREEPIDRFADVAQSPALSLGSPLAGEAGAKRREGGDGGSPAMRKGPSSLPLKGGGNGMTGSPGAGIAAAPPSPEVAVMAARAAAQSAKSLDELRALLEAFEGCMLRATATQLVFADGNPAARVMFVGEAPGRDEDIAGLPFVGRSGKLLDRMIEAIGLDRTQVYIANIVPWRPPGNRTPTPHESAICLPFIRRQIELADPDILVCLGQPSTQTLLETKEGITRTRGRWLKFDTGSREIRALATYHPAFLLRSPLQKRLAWRDFLAIKKALAQ